MAGRVRHAGVSVSAGEGVRVGLSGLSGCPGAREAARRTHPGFSLPVTHTRGGSPSWSVSAPRSTSQLSCMGTWPSRWSTLMISPPAARMRSRSSFLYGVWSVDRGVALSSPCCILATTARESPTLATCVSPCKAAATSSRGEGAGGSREALEAARRGGRRARRGGAAITERDVAGTQLSCQGPEAPLAPPFSCLGWCVQECPQSHVARRCSGHCKYIVIGSLRQPATPPAAARVQPALRMRSLIHSPGHAARARRAGIYSHS